MGDKNVDIKTSPWTDDLDRKNTQVTVLGNLKGLVRVGVKTRELQDIQITGEEFWDQGSSYEPQ